MGSGRRKVLLWGAGLSALLLAVLLGAGLLYGNRLLDDVVRPRLERLLAEHLQAEVHLGRLRWEAGAVTLADLSLVRPARYRIALPRLRVRPTLAGLLRRQLGAVALEAPHIEIYPAPGAADSALTLPAEPPLTAKTVTIRSGTFAYADPERPWQVRDLALDLQGGAAFDLALRGNLAADTPIPFVLAGAGQWKQGLQFTLDSLRWQGRALLREPVVLSLPAGADAARLRLALAVGRLERSDLQPWLAAFALDDVLPPGWDFAVEDVRLEADWQPAGLRGRVTVVDGLVRGPAVTLPLETLELSVAGRPGDWHGGGRFTLAQGATGTLEFRAGAAPVEGGLTLAVNDPSGLQKRMFGKVAVPLAGAFDLNATGAWPTAGPRLSLTLQGRPAAVPADAWLDLAALHLDATLEQRQGAWQGAGKLLLAGKPLATLRADARRLQVDLAPTPWSRLRRLAAQPEALHRLREARGVAGRVVLTRARSEWTGDVTLRAAKVAVAQGGLEDLLFNGRIGLHHGASTLANGRLRGRLVSEELGAGALQARFDARLARGAWRVDVQSFELDALEVMSPDGLAGVAGGRVQWQGQVSRSAVTAPVALRLCGRLAAEEALWGAWYGKLGALPVAVSLQARWQPHTGRLTLQESAFEVDGVARVEAQGEAHAGDLALQGKLGVADLAAAWNDRLRALLRELRPGLAGLELAGGLDAAFTLERKAGAWRLGGEARLRALAALWPDVEMTLRGGQGTLPLALAWPAGPAAEGETRRGQLSFGAFSCGPVRLADRSVRLAVGENRLSLPQSLHLAVSGGQVTVDRLHLGYSAGGARFETAIGVAGVDLERLTAELGMVPMKGSIDADLGHIRYADNLLKSDGEMRIEAFGGSLLLGNLQLDPFTLESPQFQADITFAGIDLYQLTQTFSFGAINGVVDGAVRGLRLYGATPSHFVGTLQTRLEGRRNISVKALNNLSILSQGGLSAALSRGIYRFIDFYRYRRIGIACELAEDVFTLRGTARPDDDRYLVDGGLLPPKINIIAPGRQISFREMLRRLKRIDRTGRRAD